MILRLSRMTAVLLSVRLNLKSLVYIQADDAEERRQNLGNKITIEEDCSLPRPIRVYFTNCCINKMGSSDEAYIFPIDSHDNKHQTFKLPKCL